MVKVHAFAGPPKSTKGKRKVVGPSETREQEDRGEARPIIVRPTVSEQRVVPPIVSELSDAPAAVVPLGEGLVTIEEEEEDERPLKRRRAVRVAEVAGQSPRPLDRSKGKEKVGGRAVKDKGKEKMGSAGTWESAISLDKTASIGSIEVALHIAERIIPPPDEERMDSLTIDELTGRAIRNSVREVAFGLAMRRRIELLNQEVESLRGRVDGLEVKLSEVKEEGDISRAQLSSLEEEKKFWEDDRDVLRAQLASGEDERNILRTQLASGEKERNTLRARLISEEVERVQAMAARNKLSRECTALKEKLESESRLKAKYLEDCHAAVKDQTRAEEELRRERASIKKQRIEAIRRWQRRFLQEECLEYSCDLALMILKNCHGLCVPEGSDGPSFEGFAEPMLPAAIGLSLEEVRERAMEDRGPVPDEELDLSSVEEDELPGEGIPPAAPLDPASASTFLPAAETSPGHPPTSPSVDF